MGLIFPYDNRTYTYSIVPEDYIVWLPLHAHMELLRRGDDFTEELDNHITLHLRDADYLRDETRVEE